MPERELEDPTENETSQVVAQEVRTHCVKYALIGLGAPMSVLGIVGAVLNMVTDLLNRYIFHMGKEKWLLHFGLWMIGLVGVLLVVLAFPSARGFICRCCVRHKRSRSRRSPYRALINDVEAGLAADS